MSSETGLEGLAEELGLNDLTDLTTKNAASAVSPKEALKDIQKLFSDLVPPDEITIKGSYGGRYSVPAVLPGEAEIVIMREIRALMDLGIELPADVASGGFSGIATAALTLGTNADFIKSLNKSFAAAYPDILKEELALATAKGVSPSGSAMSVFSVAEAMKVFIPFGAALIGTGAEVLGWFTTENP